MLTFPELLSANWGMRAVTMVSHLTVMWLNIVLKSLSTSALLTFIALTERPSVKSQFSELIW